MEIKKTPKADLERDISLSFLMGLVVAVAVLFVGFEWGEEDIQIATDSGMGVVIDEEEIEMTIQNEPPPPPPEPEVIKEPDILEIVEDEVEVENIQIASSEDDMSQAQLDTYVAPIEEEEEEVDENFVFVTVEKMPVFPGGELALLKWIAEHTNYPTIAAENSISGRVSCTFTVNTDGSVTDVQVVRPVDPNLDKEAIRVLRSLPKFKPGEQRGKPVRVKYNVPVYFKLQN
jgi:protein TonB